MSEPVVISTKDLWLANAKDFIVQESKSGKPITSWGKEEQAYVNFITIRDGMPNAELNDQDEKHLMDVLLVGENTSACAQMLRKLELLPKLENKSTGLANKYLTMG